MGSCWLGQEQVEEEEGGPCAQCVLAAFSPIVISWSLVVLLPSPEELVQAAGGSSAVPRPRDGWSQAETVLLHPLKSNIHHGKGHNPPWCPQDREQRECHKGDRTQ